MLANIDVKGEKIIMPDSFWGRLLNITFIRI